MNQKFDLTVIGGGLAGCEAALQAANYGLRVNLLEMRPIVPTGVHVSQDLAEVVCSNSFGSKLSDRASGLLKQELQLLNSFLLEIAEKTSVPAGRALAVDRELFSKLVTERVSSSPNIKITRMEARSIPEGPTIVASGPLTSQNLSQAISRITGEDSLFFFDAVAPIINFESIEMNKAFRASRYQYEQSSKGDYINLPFTKDEYIQFVELLRKADRIPLKNMEYDIDKGVTAGSKEFFEGCLPVEILALRGENALAYGPMRPVGLIDPHTTSRPYAVVQLRQDNLAGNLYNMVGFQTNLTIKEQKRIFTTIPGLESAQFERFGQMHRNTYIASPKLLHPSLQFRSRPDLFFAGQITGVEGYVGNIGTGLLAGINAVRLISNQALIILPQATMLGALCNYISKANLADFQPMKANFGLLAPLTITSKKGKHDRAILYSERSLRELNSYLKNLE
jgi:methylenetetrahydrofolate--tRNA-(uracil-5-)-methyltransferase